MVSVLLHHVTNELYQCTLTNPLISHALTGKFVAKQKSVSNEKFIVAALPYNTIHVL